MVDSHWLPRGPTQLSGRAMDINADELAKRLRIERQHDGKATVGTERSSVRREGRAKADFGLNLPKGMRIQCAMQRRRTTVAAENKSRKRTPVIVTVNGVDVTYPSAREAGEALGIPRATILCAARRGYSLRGKYPVRFVECEPASRVFDKPVVAYSRNGNLLRKFRSVVVAARQLGRSASCISRAIKEETFFDRRYFLKFAEAA